MPDRGKIDDDTGLFYRKFLQLAQKIAGFSGINAMWQFHHYRSRIHCYSTSPRTSGDLSSTLARWVFWQSPKCSRLLFPESRLVSKDARRELRVDKTVADNLRALPPR